MPSHCKHRSMHSHSTVTAQSQHSHRRWIGHAIALQAPIGMSDKHGHAVEQSRSHSNSVPHEAKVRKFQKRNNDVAGKEGGGEGGV